MLIERLGVNCGAQVTNVNFDDEATYPTLSQALATYEVLVFPEPNITDEIQIRMGRKLGKITTSPIWPGGELGAVESNVDNPPVKTDVWHADETFTQYPPMAAILRVDVLPSMGGDTVFASMTAAYWYLSHDMRAFIDQLYAEHDFSSLNEVFNGDIAKMREAEDRIGRPIHPVVRVHPETKKRVVFVNQLYTRKIVNINERESRLVLDTLFALPSIPELQFRVHWQKGMTVMWDNRSTQHYAVNDYYPQHRRMLRLTLAGEKPFGVIPSGI